MAVALGSCADDAQQAAADGALAQELFESGQMGPAKQAIERAVGERDDILDLQLLRARIELAAGSTAAAYDAFEDALSLDPTNGQALQGVSQLGLTTGHLDESLRATERILILAPDQPDALLTRGIHALVRHRYDKAIADADKILSVDPTHENATVLKARALFMQNDAASALAILDGLAPSASESAVVALTKLELFRELRRAPDMLGEFALLRRLRPADLMLRLDEANTRFKLKDRPAAQRLIVDALTQASAQEEVIKSAIELWQNYGAQDVTDPQFYAIAASGTPFARIATARFLLELGKLPQAERVIQSLAGDDRTGLMARLKVAQGDSQNGLHLARNILQRDQTQCDALIADSTANLALRKPADALRSGQLAAAECPDQASSWLAAADAYKALNRASGVDRVYEQAFDARPQDLKVVRHYSEWLLGQKRPREAVAVARRLTRNARALIIGWEYYGALCRRTGSACTAEALAGLANARTLFGVDLEPGAQAPNGLLGRFVRR